MFYSPGALSPIFNQCASSTKSYLHVHDITVHKPRTFPCPSTPRASTIPPVWIHTGTFSCVRHSVHAKSSAAVPAICFTCSTFLCDKYKFRTPGKSICSSQACANLSIRHVWSNHCTCTRVNVCSCRCCVCSCQVIMHCEVNINVIV